jgi:metallo-beta-lactamase class B
MKRHLVKSATFIWVIYFAFGLHVQLFAQSPMEHTSKDVYRSKELLIIQIAPNSYQHISYLQTNDFGNVPCNGLVVRDKNEVIIFDTPTNDKAAEELILWIENKLGSKIKAIIPTHFHNDCLGGLNSFMKHGIPSYGNAKTIALARETGVAVPQNSFDRSMKLRIGKQQVVVVYPGEGHTRDNVVGYFEKDKILFGGCLIKELGANKGYLGDANIKEWSATVDKVKKMFPGLKIVVPGHGSAGDKKLLDYTIDLFKQ